MAEFSTTSLASDANLEGYYKLSDLTDETANSYDLTNANSASFVSGKYGNCVDIEYDSTQYLYRANASCANYKFTSSFSVSYWVNLESDINGGVVDMDNGDSTGGWFCAIYAKRNQCGFRTGSASPNIYHETVMTLGQWYHVCLVYDTTDNTLATFVNGLKNSSAQTVDPATSTSDFCIGGSKRTGGVTYRIDGKIDDVVLFSRALTDAEVAEIYLDSSISKVSGVAQASIKEISGVTNANAKEISGVANA